MRRRRFAAALGHVCGPPEGTRIYNETTGALLAHVAAYRTSVDLTGLGLGEGEYTLGLATVDRWGSETPADQRAIVGVTIDGGGNPAQRFMPPRNLRTFPSAGGQITLQFYAWAPDPRFVRPAEYEIAEASDLTSIQATVSGQGVFHEVAIYNRTLDVIVPWAHGRTVRLRVRASDGQAGGKRGPWVAAPPAVADNQAPAAPAVKPSVTDPGC